MQAAGGTGYKKLALEGVGSVHTGVGRSLPSEGGAAVFVGQEQGSTCRAAVWGSICWANTGQHSYECSR